jgi:hypothetical protein
MKDIEKLNIREKLDDELGLMLWQLESFEKFLPCYKTMMKGH